MVEKTLGRLAASTDLDDYAARYLAWMGLGGTKAGIPGIIMKYVNNTAVLGAHRKAALPDIGENANMLQVARDLCAATLPQRESGRAKFNPLQGRIDLNWDYTQKKLAEDELYVSPLIEENGDAELWKKLCAYANPPPVREVAVEADSLNSLASTTYVYTTLYLPGTGAAAAVGAGRYPMNMPVGDDHGVVQPRLEPNNLFPWCLRDGANEHRYVNDPANAGKLPVGAPFCPRGMTPMTQDEQATWALRGAINAGFAVFLYLDGVSKGVPSAPPYNRCDAAKTASP